MDPKVEAQERARAVGAVEAFVLRARRVAAHSLCIDRESLRGLIGVRGELQFDMETGHTTLTRRWPPEEQVESLAARVRPVLLQSDPVHWGRFLKGVKFLLRGVEGAEQALEHIDEAKNHWKALTSDAEDLMAYRVTVTHLDGSSNPVEMNDLGLAWAWFYGDVVHADPARREAGTPFDITERYYAAVGVVARAAWLTCAGLVLVETLRGEGLLADLDTSIFDEQVVVTVTEQTVPAEAWVGKPGEQPPSHGFSPEDLGWERLGPGAPNDTPAP